MIKKVLLAIVLLGVGAILVFYLQSFEKRQAAITSHFTWSAFQLYWNKEAMPQIRLRNAESTDSGYKIDFRHTNMLYIFLHDERVSGVEANFVGGGNNDAGGVQFMRLVDHILRIGTFGWTAEEVAAIREHFGPIDNTHKEYRYQSSHFIRQHGQHGWNFSLTFIKNTPVPDTALSTDENSQQ